MKKITVLLILIFKLSITIAQIGVISKVGYTLKGRIDSNYQGYIYLVYYNDDNIRLKDSCVVKKGNFFFKGYVNEFSDKYYLKLDGEMRMNNDSVNSVAITIENSVMTIELKINNFSKYKMEGCTSCNTFKNILKEKDLQYLITDKLEGRKDTTSNLIEKNKIEAKINFLRNKSIEKDFTFCKKNPNSKLSPYLLYWLYNKIDKKRYYEYIGYFDKLSLKQQNSFYGIKIKENIKQFNFILKHLGKKAPNFSGIDINNEILNLDTINKNSYVLLDFWASWCAPCRVENKELRHMYAKYKTLGLEIISISDDSNTKAWRNAVIADSITKWKHILFTSTSIKRKEGINGLDNEYHIELLPTKILINRQGIIIGRYDFSESITLKNDLKKIFE